MKKEWAVKEFDGIYRQTTCEEPRSIYEMLPTDEIVQEIDLEEEDRNNN